MSDIDDKKIEIRGFLQLDSYLRKKYGKPPLLLDIEEPISGSKLAENLGISRDDIEVIFINGLVYELDHVINPGDRMAFLPPGCPGPYRIAFGFYGKNQGNEANFKIKRKVKPED